MNKEEFQEVVDSYLDCLKSGGTTSLYFPLIRPRREGAATLAAMNARQLVKLVQKEVAEGLQSFLVESANSGQEVYSADVEANFMSYIHKLASRGVVRSYSLPTSYRLSLSIPHRAQGPKSSACHTLWLSFTALGGKQTEEEEVKARGVSWRRAKRRFQKSVKEAENMILMDFSFTPAQTVAHIDLHFKVCPAKLGDSQ